MRRMVGKYHIAMVATDCNPIFIHMFVMGALYYLVKFLNLDSHLKAMIPFVLFSIEPLYYLWITFIHIHSITCFIIKILFKCKIEVIHFDEW